MTSSAVCDFCVEVRGLNDVNPLAVISRRSAAECVLASDGRTAVIPSIGALVPGHVLVCPTRHALSFGAMPYHDHDMAMAMADLFSDVLTTVFEAPIIRFEHGPGRRSKAGACVEHAHLHLLPLPTSPQVRAVSGLQWQAVNPNSVHAKMRQLTDGYGYLFLQDESGSWLADGHQVRSQEMRRVVSRLTGRPHEWDWGVFERPDNVRLTVDLLARNRTSLSPLPKTGASA